MMPAWARARLLPSRAWARRRGSRPPWTAVPGCEPAAKQVDAAFWALQSRADVGTRRARRAGERAQLAHASRRVAHSLRSSEPAVSARPRDRAAQLEFALHALLCKRHALEAPSPRRRARRRPRARRTDRRRARARSAALWRRARACAFSQVGKTQGQGGRSVLRRARRRSGPSQIVRLPLTPSRSSSSSMRRPPMPRTATTSPRHR